MLLHRAVMLLAAPARAPSVVAFTSLRFGFVIAAFWLVGAGGRAALIAAAAGFTLAAIGARFVVGRG